MAGDVVGEPGEGNRGADEAADCDEEHGAVLGCAGQPLASLALAEQHSVADGADDAAQHHERVPVSQAVG